MTLAGQIPLRTFGEWQTPTRGALQGDLALNCEESSTCFFLCSLVGVDVAMSWTELEAIRGLGRQRMGTGFHRLWQRPPCPLREKHSDNGSECLNLILLPWCRREWVRVTRGPGSRKNDQAWVKKKN